MGYKPYVKTASGLVDLLIDASSIVQDNNHRFVTDTEKTVWNNKLDDYAILTNVIYEKHWQNTFMTGATSFKSINFWFIDDELYYSENSTQKVWNKVTKSWVNKVWSGLASFLGSCVWKDGENIYYSNNADQYILNKETSTWENKTWSGLTNFNKNNIWKDGENIYYSDGTKQYILNKKTSTWEQKTWNKTIYGIDIWTDGENIYYSNDDQYVLNKTTNTWEDRILDGITNTVAKRGRYTWTDGKNVYRSLLSYQYIFNKSALKWETWTWTSDSEPIFRFRGDYVFKFRENIYYSNLNSGNYVYILNKNVTSYKIDFLHKIADTGSYNDLTNKPSFSTVATTGSYNDLLNKPTIPTSTNQLINNNFIRYDIDTQGLTTTQQESARINIGMPFDIDNQYISLKEDKLIKIYEDGTRIIGDSNDPDMDAVYGAYGVLVENVDNGALIKLKYPFSKTAGTYTLATLDDISGGGGGSIEIEDLRNEV